MRKPSSPALPAAATRVDRYVLLDELGRGGMGAVYLARMEGSWRGYERVVALKTIQRELAERADSRRMFFDEIRIASRLNHPNVVGVIDFGETESMVWFTMDYVHGISVRDLLAAEWAEAGAERWPLVAARIVADACEGLHAAHELCDGEGRSLRVVHRDVSPANLVVGFDGYTRVVDFGVASALDRMHRTATGQFRGKLPYASPEHLDGRELDRRADVWSLGVVLWEMCARRRLFAYRSMTEIYEAITVEPIPPLSEYCPGLPKGLDEVVWKCLQRDRSRRFATAREVGDELRLVLAEHLDVLGPGDVARFLAQAVPGYEPARDRRLERAKERAASTPDTQIDPMRELPGETDPARGAPAARSPWPLLLALLLGVALGAAAAFFAGG